MDHLRSLLLDLISPAHEVAQHRIDAMSQADWQAVVTMVRQHRLGPLLHWQLGQAHRGLRLPSEIRTELAQTYNASALRSLTIQRELVLIHRILQQAGLPYMALKGACLAFHAYPNPALRPLRDLDILVPSGQALHTYQVLLDSGLSRQARNRATPEGAMQHSQHLPPLHSPSGSITVELHSRLLHVPRDATHRPDPTDDPRFWQRLRTARLANTEIGFESPTDLLLHLIVHAVYDHEFNNGPLTLSDLAFLLDTHTMDWPLFWTLAERGGHVRGCLLAFRLLQRYWGDKPVVWPPHADTADAPTDEQVNTAAQLMLRDFDLSNETPAFQEFIKKRDLPGKTRYVLNKVFAPKAIVALSYPVRQDDWRIYFWYPARWWHMLSAQLPRLWRSGQWRAVHRHQLRHETEEAAVLRRWLQGSSV